MATIHLPPDFKEFLRLLNAHRVEYLLIGGYAVNDHRYRGLRQRPKFEIRTSKPETSTKVQGTE